MTLFEIGELDAVFEIRTWAFPNGHLTFKFFHDAEAAAVKAQKRGERKLGMSFWNHKAEDGSGFYVTLLGPEGAFEEFRLPKPVGGVETELHPELQQALLLRRLRVEGEVELERIEDPSRKGWVAKRARFGRRGAHMTPDGEIQIPVGGDQ